MKRFIKFGLISILSLMVLLLLLLFFIAGTERGTSWAWNMAQDYMPETLQTDRLTGRLTGPLYIEGLKFTTDQISVQFEHGELDWSPRSLLNSTVQIEQLLINGLHITQTAPQDTGAEVKESIKLPAEINFPVTIKLNNIEINDFQYQASDSSEPLIIDHAKLDSHQTGNHLVLKSLQVSSPLFQIDAKAELDTKGDYPLTGSINWQVNPTGFENIIGQSIIKGDLQNLTINSKLDTPYNTTANIDLQQPLNNLVANIALKTDHLIPLDIQPGWPELPLSGIANGSFNNGQIIINNLSIKPVNLTSTLEANGTINLTGSQPIFDLKTSWQKLQWPLEGEAQVSSPEGKLHITGTPENLASDLFARINGDGEVTGQINRRAENIEMALNWKDLVLPVAETQLLLPAGNAKLSGTVDDYLLKLDTVLDVPEQTNGHIKVAGRGNLKQIQLDSVDIEALDGELKGSADISWQPSVDIKLDLKGKNLNPGILYSEWPGQLAPVFQLNANNKNGHWQIQTQQINIKGKLRDYPVDLTAQATLEKQKLTLTTLHLLSGKSRLELSGIIDKQFDLTWQLDSNNLGEVWPDALGEISGHGKITGLPPYPKIEASLQGKSISINAFSANTIELISNLDTRLQETSTLQLGLENAQYAGTQYSTVSLQANGIAEKHHVKLMAKTSQGDLDLAIQGNLQQPWQPDANWNAVVERADFAPSELASWQLDQPIKVTYSKKRSQIEPGCWITTPSGRLCLEGVLATTSNGKFQLSDLPLTYFQSLYPPDIQLQGSLEGTGTVSSKNGQPLLGKVALSTTSGQLMLSDASTPTKNNATGAQQSSHLQTLLSFGSSTANVTFDDKAVSINTKLNLSDDDHFLLDLYVKNSSKPFIERSISGQFQSSLHDLSFIDVLSYDIDNTQGQLQSNMQLSGQLGKPQLTGKLELSGFSANLLQPGLSLNNGHFTLTGYGQQGLELNAVVTSGEGQIELTGTVNLLEEQWANISLKGENVTVTDTPDAHVIATPDLTLGFSDKHIKLNGRLVIPYADITPRKLPESAVTVSNDQIILKPGQQGSQKSLSRSLLADLYLILGEDVNIDSFGLKANIAGAVRIQERPGEPATGSGELKIMKGQYQAYGQDLTIKQGRVLFTGGPLSRPGLDFRAVRQPRENIEVGIQVRGNLKNPDFTLFSSPSMTQQVQLSYLIFGRPPNEASGTENSALNRAAMALGMKGGDFLTKNIGKHIGIDEIGIQTAHSSTGTEQAALMLGKYLSPKLYVSYGLGLFEPISTFKLQYFINRKWKLVTESSGVRSGGDIFYTIERGK